MPFTHSDYRFSVTLHTKDCAVVNCLRALSQISQLEGNVRIPWGGTKDADWQRAGHKVTFRFTAAAYRQAFVEVADRVIRAGLWQEVSRSDSDPARPQSESEHRADDAEDEIGSAGFLSGVSGRLPEEVTENPRLYEGAVSRITINAYERNPAARRQCIEAHGTICAICGFNFGAVYGTEAEGYIHVHHLKPFSEIGGEYVIDPVEDLCPVCPNCHAVLHMGDRCRSIDEVRQLLHRQQRLNKVLQSPGTATLDMQCSKSPETTPAVEL